ncbi:rRNA maturation RNase YbeY [Candidatus Kaiserbacteria bacterium CG10_big_fil_rev_8_21_14_0_10_49_17]|uniref:Endoribonuclease YbeY n=1 Tax=Candidatus Kaiserbacteria bacterium CG10_big_fil_rev_8_21_14_0_10_49_17 TaxID=1974609 RepID=A0A2M6WDR5_9BACT|nr:MAG: rRNA maturation RNase YbeY [Candidatus Kaiserbacteria bacterium CG10_big_fil_rev_8_21_14_0_10_49_17]
MAELSIRNTTRQSLPRLPFARMKDSVLGKTYDLSLVFIGATRARRLNVETRGKDYVPTVLSFPLSKESGEIFICLSKALQEAPAYGKTPSQFIGYLFIHGLLHLDGLTHGSTMDKSEQMLSKKFDLN